MKVNNVHLVYFSATDTTKKVLKCMSDSMGIPSVKLHSTMYPAQSEISFSGNDLVIFGVPVYSGRIPAIAADTLQSFRGNNTPAIVVVVYGNREYDDSLLELKDLAEASGFKLVGAGAFIAQHSIFPLVAHGRPDIQDEEIIQEFGKKCMDILEQCDDLTKLPSFTVKGNFPYRAIQPVPIKPKTNNQCTICGVCAKACPTNAIDAQIPRKTDKKLCISCARCIMVCPRQARYFGGILYKIGKKKFISAYGAIRKEPELFYAV